MTGTAARTLDASDRLVLPGGVDVHAHIEQRSGMGLMNADTFETATAAAAHGGTTSVISFAAQARGQRLRDAVDDYAARARRGARIDHAFHMIVRNTGVPDFADDLTGANAAMRQVIGEPYATELDRIVERALNETGLVESVRNLAEDEKRINLGSDSTIWGHGPVGRITVEDLSGLGITED